MLKPEGKKKKPEEEGRCLVDFSLGAGAGEAEPDGGEGGGKFSSGRCMSQRKRSPHQWELENKTYSEYYSKHKTGFPLKQSCCVLNIIVS